MNNNKLIKWSTPSGYSTVLTHFDSINRVWFKNDHPSKTEKPSFTNIYMSVSFKVFLVYIMSCICLLPHKLDHTVIYCVTGHLYSECLNQSMTVISNNFNGYFAFLT